MSNADDSNNTVAMTDAQPSKEPAPAAARPPTGVKAWVLGWFARHQFLTFVVLLVGACSFSLFDRHVSWEEEVPLNTGETIWVKRHVTYKFDVTHDNPFVPSYIPDWTETLEFKWQGRRYSYTGMAGIMLIAISPFTKQPVLVAKATTKNWDYRNNYKCTIPYYVQFSSDASGEQWSWPPKVEPWLYGLPYNLMYHRPKPSRLADKYTVQDRKKLDDGTIAGRTYMAYVDENFSFNECKK